MICEACEGEGMVRGKDPQNPGALVILPCLECDGSGVAPIGALAFLCVECGAPVFDVLGSRKPQDRCRLCRPPIVEASYRDDTFEPRKCDHCGKPYRGPAVYCSLTCAISDA